jgi:guanidinopropionase
MDYKPTSGRVLPRFSGIKTFFRLPHVSIDQDYEVGILGVPFDGGLTYRPGARFAPSKVRELSSLGRGYHWSRGINIFNELKVADIGDAPTVPISRERSYEQIQQYAEEILEKNKKLISVGGDHSITLPLLRAFKKKYKAPLNLIHFDAHLDTYPAAWDEEYHHGSFLRHAINEGLVNGENCLQIGIRGPLAGGDDLEFVKKHKVKMITVDNIREDGLQKTIESLPHFEGPTYMSFDIDCLDPAYAPGTGTPVIGGLTTYESQKIMRSLKIKNLVGGDLVEISPPYDPTEITALAGVDVVFEMLCLMNTQNS